MRFLPHFVNVHNGTDTRVALAGRDRGSNIDIAPPENASSLAQDNIRKEALVWHAFRDCAKWDCIASASMS